MKCVKEEYDVDAFTVKFGKDGVQLNPNIFKINGVEDTPELRLKLLETHVSIFKLFEKYKESSRTTFEDLNTELTILNFELQKLWGFPLNFNFHTYWLQVPGCVCPKLDNKDLFGTPYRNYSSGCPIHRETFLNASPNPNTK